MRLFCVFGREKLCVVVPPVEIFSNRHRCFQQLATSSPEKKAVIPAHCFERSALHGFAYIARDTAYAALCVFLAYSFLSVNPPASYLTLEGLKYVVGWNLYAFWMGCVLTGHWVIAHECGHGAFSDSQFLNDCVGFVLHQALLVPYDAWKYR